MTVTEKIKLLLSRQKKTQTQLAKEIGVSKQYINFIINKSARKLQKDKMEKIATFLNTTVPELFYNKEEVIA